MLLTFYSSASFVTFLRTDAWHLQTKIFIQGKTPFDPQGTVESCNNAVKEWNITDWS